ncbi:MULTISPECIES: MFS transporter permease [unclassified Microcoleus]|uniref:MFS transporter permease n=2 Tax=unclassified Microcoleus TaxID=2642155 RepID=UPI001DAEA59C|nr:MULTISPECIES: MFS transporter permease [unclassified Microcoleus]MCC3478868.1 MFS transporter permease [Microcoleus sp. PH2017_12_PCY_D_A]MCC3528480.1 MFS transporter permease [Microcoleus sp. PH2017_21_RUC_O_A]MCC3540656.1 MFS transporter permease [Microcoleus sp. PH2017_22_RUC_O_B]
MTNLKITDPMFAKAIADVSVNHTLFFTPRQLFYFLDQRSRTQNENLFGLVYQCMFYNFWCFFIGGLFLLSAGMTNELIYAMLAVNILLLAIFFVKSRSRKYPYKQRQTFARALQIWGGIFMLCGIGLSQLLYSSEVFFASFAIGILSIYLGSLKIPKLTQEVILTFNLFQYWINKWTEINSSIAKMLPPPRDTNKNAVVNPDVSAYSFDRLVVCDRPEIAQFLIANNFHFENNCAVLSITGYPQSIFNTTMEMLRRNPDLRVYALHDCSPKGIGLVHHLRTSPNWFRDNSAIIIDIGLLPKQILAGGGSMFVLSSEKNAQDAKQLSAEIRQDLSAEELQWLEFGNYVELESFSPQKLIQILNRGIAGSRDIGSDDSSLILLGGTDSSIYVVDSFG